MSAARPHAALAPSALRLARADQDVAGVLSWTSPMRASRTGAMASRRKTWTRSCALSRSRRRVAFT